MVTKIKIAPHCLGGLPALSEATSRDEEALLVILKLVRTLKHENLAFRKRRFRCYVYILSVKPISRRGFDKDTLETSALGGDFDS